MAINRLAYARMIQAHYEVEGQLFPSVWAVHNICKARGFDGSSAVTGARLKAGATTWAALCAPKSHAMDAVNAGRARRQQQEREEMARLCAELDARKERSK